METLNNFPKISLMIDEGTYPFTDEQRKELRRVAQTVLTEQAKALKIKLKCKCTVEMEITTKQTERTAI